MRKHRLLVAGAALALATVAPTGFALAATCSATATACDKTCQAEGSYVECTATETYAECYSGGGSNVTIRVVYCDVQE